MSVFANAIEKWSDLADAAGTPRQTAATATAATATASATTATSATATATAAAPGYLHAALGRCSIFLIENIERGQTDVGDFFFTKREFVTQSDGWRLGCVRRRRDCC